MRAADAPLILVANSDAHASEELASALRGEGLQVVSCRHAAIAVDAVAFHRPSVIVADVSMDDGHGWDIVASARVHGNLPTIVRRGRLAVRPLVTHRHRLEDINVGFDALRRGEGVRHIVVMDPESTALVTG